MSATQETTNYGLPLYTGTDYSNFFDMNTTNNKLDEILKGIQTTAEGADSKADANTSAINQANDTINDNMTSIDHLQTDLLSTTNNVNTLTTEVSGIRADLAGVETTLQVVQDSATENSESIATLNRTTAKIEKYAFSSTISLVNSTEIAIIGNNSVMECDIIVSGLPSKYGTWTLVAVENINTPGFTHSHFTFSKVGNTFHLYSLVDSNTTLPTSGRNISADLTFIKN